MALLAAPAAARPPEVAALPELARIDDVGPTVVILRGSDLTKKRAARMERLARRVYLDLERRFIDTTKKEERPAIDVCMFETTAAYTAFVRRALGAGDWSTMGFYLPSERLVMVNLGKSVGNLRHELAHPLLGDDYPDIPSWLNEGIGSLYGTVRDRDDGIRFVVNYRLRHLRQARAADTVPTLEQVAASTRAEVYGPRAMVYYGLSRYLLLYMDRKGELSDFYGEMRDYNGADALARLQKRVDWTEFLKWVDGLKLRGEG